MKKRNLLLLLFAAFIFTFTSCTEDPISEIDTTEIPTDIDEDMYNPLLDNIENRDDLEGGLELGCFSIDTPFSLDIDGTILEINTYEDLENAFAFDSSDVAVNVDFVYPLNITYENGETSDLVNAEALGEAFAECIPDHGYEEPDSTGFDGAFPAFLINEANSCYELIYPVTLQDTDGIIYITNNEDELIDVLATEEFLVFVFPISLAGENETSTANSVEELFDILLDCQNQPWDEENEGEENENPLNIGGIACYDIAFPVGLTLINGGEILVDSYEELSTAILNGDIEDFVYPINLTNVQTNEVTSPNNDEELSIALDACYDDNNGSGGTVDPSEGGDAIIFFIFSTDFDGDCYTINFPIDITTPEDEQITYSSVADIGSGVETNEILLYNLVYPISVLNGSGETITLEDQQDLINLLENCQ